ncbi:MAG: hypothetical protein ABTD50_13920 [Polyangiaceae bacterium]|jgi:hypothetical protein
MKLSTFLARGRGGRTIADDTPDGQQFGRRSLGACRIFGQRFADFVRAYSGSVVGATEVMCIARSRVVGKLAVGSFAPLASAIAVARRDARIIAIISVTTELAVVGA